MAEIAAAAADAIKRINAGVTSGFWMLRLIFCLISIQSPQIFCQKVFSFVGVSDKMKKGR